MYDVYEFTDFLTKYFLSLSHLLVMFLKTNPAVLTELILLCLSARVCGAKLTKLDKEREAQPTSPTEVALWKEASNHNTSLTQCGARIKSPGNGSICKIQQVANQNQPACSMMVPAKNSFTCTSEPVWKYKHHQLNARDAKQSLLKQNSILLILWLFSFPYFLGMADCAVANKVNCDEKNTQIYA